MRSLWLKVSDVSFIVASRFFNSALSVSWHYSNTSATEFEQTRA
jgi:hypothetical protein